MKLLFDQNLSPTLAQQLADLFPGSLHVESLGMGQADDDVIWHFAASSDFVIVSKDEDFNLMGVVRGTPPKVIWLQLGNCTTAEVEAAIRGQHSVIESFSADRNSATLAIR